MHAWRLETDKLVFSFSTMHNVQKMVYSYQYSEQLRNVEYSIQLVMSELSIVRCDRVFGLWLQVHGRRVLTESCRGGDQAGRQLWRPLLDRGRKRRRTAGFLVCATKTDGG